MLEDRSHARLLQHDFGYPYTIRIAILSPRQMAAMHPIPLQQLLLKPAYLAGVRDPRHGLEFYMRVTGPPVYPRALSLRLYKARCLHAAACTATCRSSRGIELHSGGHCGVTDLLCLPARHLSRCRV